MSAHPRRARNTPAPILPKVFAAAIAAIPWPGTAAAASATGHVSVTILPSAAVSESAAMNAGAPERLRTRVPLSGAFTLSGAPYTVVTLSLAPGMALAGPGAGVTLAALTHNAGASPSLSAAGMLTVLVRASAALGPSSAQGSYSGSYGVTVNY